MPSAMTAIEMTGTVNEYRQLQLDGILPVPDPARVRVIVLYPDTNDVNDREWLYAATHNPAFDFLKEPEEDIYSLQNGKPFHDEI